VGALLNPILFPETWDVIFVGQVMSPGIVSKVSGFDRVYDWDVKKGKGTVGATTTFTGKPPAEGSFTFQLWKEDHFTAWDAFVLLLKYEPTKKAVSAVDVYHPALVSSDVTSLVTQKISPVLHVGGGLYEVTVSFLEYFPAAKKNATGTPDGSKTTQKGTTPGTPPDPIADAQQEEIRRLLAQASAP